MDKSSAMRKRRSRSALVLPRVMLDAGSLVCLFLWHALMIQPWAERR